MLGWEFPPLISGGLATHCFALTKSLSALGVEIDFYMPFLGKKISHPWVNIIQVPLKYTKRTDFGAYTTVTSKIGQPFVGNFFEAVQAYNASATEELAERHAAKPYDLIHCHDWMTIRAGLDARKKTGLKVVFTVHSTEIDRTGGMPWEWILSIERQGAQKADRIIAVSERTRKQVVEKLGAAPEKTRVIYNAIEASEFTAPGTKQQLKEKLGFDHDKIALFYGRLSVQKGPEYFLQAARLVLDREPKARFIIVGKGELLPKLINLAANLGLGSRATFTGFLPQEQVSMAYAASDCYVMPSVSEPFGITALEAMAAGTPVIASKNSGVIEVAHHVLRADFWDVNDLARKMLAVFAYPELSSQMISGAGEQAKRLTWPDIAKQTLDYYQETLSR
jgi:glycosyltransferase involved in cell wall biosynthesis